MILWLIILISMFNFFQFREIDNKNVLNYRAVSTYETPDITVVGMRSETARTKWLEWITLGKIAPNSLIYIPETSYFNKPEHIASMHAFGKVDSTKVIDNKPEIQSLDEIVKDNLIATGEDIVPGNPAFAIAINTGLLLNLEEHRIKGLMTDPRQHVFSNKEFVLFEWLNPENAPFHPAVDIRGITFYSLLVDISLLPIEFQQAIKS